MMKINATLPLMTPDEQLLQDARAGDREAFGQIVERHQSLICSLAYSACGDLARSEDLAQETFVTAWQRLGELREPGKLRAWLCGIVRNRAANVFRREQRRGGTQESLDESGEHTAPGADPAEQAVTREEEALLWRALAGLPENYREAMVLFYREQQSVAEVAGALELSEEAVRQRLSRGRTMLREEMTALVESTLTRTKPGLAFKMAVLVALPMASASTASAALTAGAVAGGGAGPAAKGILAKLGLGALLGPVFGLVCAWLGTGAAASTARSERERACILRHARRRIVVFCFAMSLGLAAVLSQAGKLYESSAGWIILGVSLWTFALVGGILLMCHRMDREVARIRIETKTTDEDYAQVLAAEGKQLRLPKRFESKRRLLGLPLFAMAWGGAGSDQHRPRAVCAWIAVGDTAISPLIAFGGLAIAPIAVGAITVGVLSLSIFWGVAVGVLALGSLAFGWWAIGCAAVGWKGAVGFAALARDYAVGIAATATEANSQVAKDWLKTQWFADFIELIVRQSHWWLLAIVAAAVALSLWRDRSSRRNLHRNAP